MGKAADAGEGEEAISPFSALATALAATIGTGNIVGVSTAIAIGGPGAVFWCWMTGILGIATCYAECFLAVKYRVQDAKGRFLGGPMYILEHRLHQKGAAILFALAVVLVSLGMGCGVQAASITTAVTEQAAVPAWGIGLVLAVLTGVVVLGGAKQISKICTWLVPFMSVFYFGGCLLLIWLNRGFLPETLAVIVRCAFTGKSVLGGSVGGAVMLAMRTGISRGLFTNEAGLGSIPMAAASSKEQSAHKQALVSMTGPFWDTVVMCAITGIALVSCMVRQADIYKNVAGERWCFVAFSQLPFGGDEILSISLVLFAFATIIGWHYYGNCAVRYLAGERGLFIYRLLYIVAVFWGATVPSDFIWGLSDFFNIAMAVPNLCCLWMLRREVIN
jgi:AGCS family alanine or glycine:cation symporter